MSDHRSQTTSGIVAGLLAFVSWGLVPIYWRLIKHVPATEILSHRMIWSLIFCSGLMFFGGQWSALRTQTPRLLAITFGRSLLITANWLIFIWAVNAGHVVETSMGYFITPLVNVLLGVVLLREKLGSRQWMAVGLAGCGVIVAAAEQGHGFPWIAAGLALTFGFYSVFRKMAAIAPLPGLFLETAFMTPIAAGFLLLKPDTTQLWPVFTLTPLVLIGGGIVTALPLLWFAQAAKNLRLTTVSFLGYLAPSMTFLLGIFVYHEPFSQQRLVAFCFIWAGIIVFSIDAWLRSRQTTRPIAIPEAKSVSHGGVPSCSRNPTG
ncbi:MAG TPA: EamA family transporter RarD [Chthoniobacterales bacterium]